MEGTIIPVVGQVVVASFADPFQGNMKEEHHLGTALLDMAAVDTVLEGKLLGWVGMEAGQQLEGMELE